MDFADAFKALLRGSRIARPGWNGRGMSVFLTDMGDDFADHIVCIASTAGVYPWNPSQQDMMADDWQTAPGESIDRIE